MLCYSNCATSVVADDAEISGGCSGYESRAQVAASSGGGPDVHLAG